MERWRGRVAIVTGASSGIGESIAKSLAENGMKVVGVARRLDRLQELKAKIKGEFHLIKCDVTKEEDIINAVQWTKLNLGGADVLVNNAGIAPVMPICDFNTDRLKALYDTNVIGLSIFTREVLKCMKERKVDDGHIFHINSVGGHYVFDLAGQYLYFGSKHAVTALTEGLRRELRESESKIRVTSISPGLVKTEIFEASLFSPEQIEAFLKECKSLDSKDIADALLYALGTPPHVQVHEILIRPVGENF